MVKRKQDSEQIPRYADMLAAMGTESRLRIMRLLLSAHPEGLVVGDIGTDLGIPSSTLSHHLDKLKHEDLVRVRREGTFLWYSANAEALQELLGLAHRWLKLLSGFLTLALGLILMLRPEWLAR